MKVSEKTSDGPRYGDVRIFWEKIRKKMSILGRIFVKWEGGFGAHNFSVHLLDSKYTNVNYDFAVYQTWLNSMHWPSHGYLCHTKIASNPPKQDHILMVCDHWEVSGWRYNNARPSPPLSIHMLFPLPPRQSGVCNAHNSIATCQRRVHRPMVVSTRLWYHS